MVRFGVTTDRTVVFRPILEFCQEKKTNPQQIFSSTLLLSQRMLHLVKPIVRRTLRPSTIHRCFSSTPEDHWTEDRVSGYFGHNFPDFIEHWNRDTFRRVGYVLGASTGALAAGSIVVPAVIVPTVILGALTTAYWKIGLNDMRQKSHAIRRNYPVLGNMRYILETVRSKMGHIFGFINPIGMLMPVFLFVSLNPINNEPV